MKIIFLAQTLKDIASTWVNPHFRPKLINNSLKWVWVHLLVIRTRIGCSSHLLAEEHKAQRYRFKVVLPSTLNYRSLCSLSKGKLKIKQERAGSSSDCQPLTILGVLFCVAGILPAIGYGLTARL